MAWSRAYVTLPLVQGRSFGYNIAVSKPVFPSPFQYICKNGDSIIKNTEVYIATHHTFTFRRPGSVVGIATGCRLHGPRTGFRWGARFSAPVQNGPGAHPAFCTVGTGSFPGVKSGQFVTLIPHRLVVLWSRKSRAIPLLPLWAVRPVQSLGARTRVHFIFLRWTSRCAIV